jgi:glycosyltransferase involved in cell wall biosynthesis
LKQQRISIVTSQLLGYTRNAGAGTATTFLAVALARTGHRVEVLYSSGAPATATIDPEWKRLYSRAGVAIRPLLAGGERVEPELFAHMRTFERTLGAEPPDVVIAHDFAAPAYTALWQRQAGLAFEHTLFVVLSHGTRRWGKEALRSVRASPDLLEESVLECALIELADVLVSPSAYLIEWMREQGWTLPARTRVIPYLSRSGATGEPPPAARSEGDGRVERLAFFGRLEERKGLRPFAAGLNALDPRLLEGIELEFLGKPTKQWSPARVEGLLSETARRALRGISFQTDLDQPEVLARLARPGTLAVMPSLGETFSNAVYECLERGIPFISSDAGAPPELIAAADRPRVLFPPTAEGVASALTRALRAEGGLRPARPAFDDADSLEAWAEVVAMRPPARGKPAGPPSVDVVVHHRGDRQALARCLAALARQRYRKVSVFVVAAQGAEPELEPAEGLDRPLLVRCARGSVEAAREAGLAAGRAQWVVFLDEEDVPEPELLDALVRAQAASGADVVSCGLYLEEEEGGRTLRFFAGQPRALGLLENGYGTVALLRRSLLAGLTAGRPAEGDPDWPLLARLSASGAQIVSVPTPLLTRRARPGTLERHPADALLVAAQFERALPDQLHSLARLAAGLAANAQEPPAASPGGIARRAVRVARAEGLPGLARRTGQCAFRPFSGWRRG